MSYLLVAPDTVTSVAGDIGRIGESQAANVSPLQQAITAMAAPAQTPLSRPIIGDGGNGGDGGWLFGTGGAAGAGGIA